MECSRLPNELIFVGIGFKLTTVQENSIETDAFERRCSKDGIISSKLLTEKLTESQKIDPELIEGGETALKKMRSQLYEYLIKSVEYEEKEAICDPHRNSYYKTDHDATAMLIKIGVMQFSNKEINLDIVELLGRSSPIKKTTRKS